MNFFDQQDIAKRNSLILLGVFAAAMIVFGWIISQLTSLFTLYLQYRHPNLFSPNIVDRIQTFNIVALWSYILYKSYSRHRDINYGGGVLAESFGAVSIQLDEPTKNERELQNVIAEMAVASSQELLPCYVLRNEPGINAFVLGKQDQPALVVTQGVIDELERDELSAVVAHEYAHISNHDLKLNMHMLVALGGLNAISELGLTLFENASKRRDESVSTFEGLTSVGSFLLIAVAAVCIVLGPILTLFGDIIKSGFSRKRELLADAKAVQYTRNTWALANVLNKASNDAKKPALNSVYSGELEHLCLNGPWKHSLFSGWLANHPAPDSRIALIEPHFSVKQRSRRRMKDTQQKQGNSQHPRASMSIGTGVDAQPIHQIENELSVVLSIMVGTSGYNEKTTQANFQSAMRCYTPNEVALRSSSEPGITEEFEQALQELQKQSPAQKFALLDHFKEIMQHDGISTPEEKAMLESITQRLNPPGKAA